MTIDIAVILGVVQALTEFLPVSSSGHLVVFQSLLSANNVPLAFDVLVHLATLVVFFVYLRKEIFEILKHVFTKTLKGKEARYLVLIVLLATIPGAIVGLGFKDQIHDMFKTTTAASFGFFATSALLLLADWKQRKSSEETSEQTSHFGWLLPTHTQAILIGSAQAIAITPGISRSGATIAMSLILGLPVSTALKFSFLISIPAILGAGLLEAEALSSLASSEALVYLVGFIVTALVGFFALKMLIVVTKNKSLKYFAIYTFLLGLFLQFSQV